MGRSTGRYGRFTSFQRSLVTTQVMVLMAFLPCLCSGIDCIVLMQYHWSALLVGSRPAPCGDPGWIRHAQLLRVRLISVGGDRLEGHESASQSEFAAKVHGRVGRDPEYSAPSHHRPRSLSDASQRTVSKTNGIPGRVPCGCSCSIQSEWS